MLRSTTRFSLMGLFLLHSSLAFAQTDPNAVHEAVASGSSTQFPEIIIASVNDEITTGSTIHAVSQEFIDAMNIGYRYFGLLSLEYQGEDALALNASATTTISNLDDNTDYLFVLTRNALNVGNATVTFTVTDDNGTFTSTFSSSGEALSGTEPIIFSNTTSLSIDVNSTGDVGTEAIGIVSVVEIITNTSYHNDCDINDDATVDDLDIDMLRQALRSGVFANITNTNLIAMYDVNDDDVVDWDDEFELIYVCLGTDAGDPNLDGYVDELDYAIALANYTGNIGESGGKGFSHGDVDGDGDVDDIDLTWIDSQLLPPE